MPLNAHALQFLDRLERAEAGLLVWGLVDGFFTETELERRADDFGAAVGARGIDTGYASGWELVEALLDARLLWKLPQEERYRTRMAEAVRLLARLRQIFWDPRGVAWQNAPALVADYRLLLRPRAYPRRDVPLEEVLAAIRHETSLLPLQESVIRELLQASGSEPRRLAGFQVRAACRILRSSGSERPTGTVICAGTGSGKTLAFYLPAYAAIAPSLSGEYWTKCLAIYPRNELLKDQLREAIVSARRMASVVGGTGRRKLVLGALYGDTPTSPERLLDPTGMGARAWRRLTIRGVIAFECPLVRCPRCNQSMAWLERDVQRRIERLVCTDTQCTEQLAPDEIRLTRDRMFLEPPDMLFTTTEMLNQRMSSARYARLFGIGLRPDRRPSFVLLDEVHTYEGVHGAHVALLLRRWRRLAEARPHIVGLSATLSDAARFFAELTGVGPGDVAEIAAQAAELEVQGTEYLVALRGDPSSGTSLLSTTIQAAMLLRRVLAPERGAAYYGNRIFAFSDNLDVINRLFHNLLDAEGWDSSGRPNPRRLVGSLANLRATTLPHGRERLEAGQNWALVEDIGHVLAPGSRVRVGRTSSQDTGVEPDAEIVVATASLELGFDDPDVGAVLQHKAPHSPAAFLQRRGRAGRRREMRPWTVVVLSDYGRDRSAYQAYDQLFSPHLPPRHLPLGNRAVLRMQATYALLDFLARSLPPESSPEPWMDLSQPVVTTGPWAERTRERQVAYGQRLGELLEQPAARTEFANFLARSLAIDEDMVTALLWEPPRALLTEAIPTLLRRLERNWARSSGTGHEHYIRSAPLPEFVPRTLFSDLNLPEVTVRIPAHGRNLPNQEMMPLAQALREFAPGRVSRRFGVAHARLRYWVDAGMDDDLPVDRVCPAADRQELGRFSYRDGGRLVEAPVFRPYAIDVTQPAPDVQQTSNAFLEWHTQLVPTEDGHEIDVPDGIPLADIVRPFRFHTHQLGLPVEARRFATGVVTSVGRGRGRPITRRLRFVCEAPGGTRQQAALGFIADVDAVQVRFGYPGRLYERCATNARLMHGLRPARFYYLVRTAGRLDGLANRFQRDWLARAYLSATTVEALRSGQPLDIAEAAVADGRTATSLADILQTLLQWAADDPDDNLQDAPDGSVDDVDDARPRRLRELEALLHVPETQAVLREAAGALWEPLNEAWEQWLRARFKATLAAAFAEAAHDLCPRMDYDAILIDLEASPRLDPSGSDTGEDEFWLTEATIGGGGFVEEFLARYAEDPRRYFRLLEAALGQSDLEWVSDELGRVLRYVTSRLPEDQALAVAFEAIRSVQGHEASARALAELQRTLMQRGISPTPTFLVSLNARLLAPGTSASTDAFLGSCVRDWDTAEQSLGIEIDLRLFALLQSGRSELEQALQVVPPGDSDHARAAWRYGVLSGMLWARGTQVRHESLRAYNPFFELPECDRLIVLATVPRLVHQVALTDETWFEQATRALVERGVTELVASAGEPARLADALFRLGCEPIDSGALLVYVRVIGIQRDANQLIATLELPEAFQ
jgi:hypothetical protein